MNYYLITNEVEKALFYQNIGVEFLMVDLEQFGKEKRQKNLNTVKNFHTIEDVIKIRKFVTKSKLVVRLNPIHYNSESEIIKVIDAGADIIMLPYFRTSAEIRTFYHIIRNSNVKTILLFEHIDSLEKFDEIMKEVNIEMLDAIHFGLNDLSLSMGIEFMFSILATDTLNTPIEKCNLSKIKFGIGGIAGVGTGKIPGEIILKEYKRLGACRTILSRSFQQNYILDVEKEIALYELRKIGETEYSRKELNDNYELLMKLLK